MLFWLIVGFGAIALVGILNQYFEDKREREYKMKEIERKLKAIESKEGSKDK